MFKKKNIDVIATIRNGAIQKFFSPQNQQYNMNYIVIDYDNAEADIDGLNQAIDAMYDALIVYRKAGKVNTHLSLKLMQYETKLDKITKEIK